jgi:hypothetical protein
MFWETYDRFFLGFVILLLLLLLLFGLFQPFPSGDTLIDWPTILIQGFPFVSTWDAEESVLIA